MQPHYPWYISLLPDPVTSLGLPFLLMFRHALCPLTNPDCLYHSDPFIQPLPQTPNGIPCLQLNLGMAANP